MDTKLLCNRVIIHEVHYYIVHCSFASNVLYANACSQELVNLHILFDLDSNIDKIIDWILQNMNNYAQVRIALWKGKNVLTDLAHPVHVIEFVSTSKQRCFPSGQVYNALCSNVFAIQVHVVKLNFLELSYNNAQHKTLCVIAITKIKALQTQDNQFISVCCKCIFGGDWRKHSRSYSLQYVDIYKYWCFESRIFLQFKDCFLMVSIFWIFPDKVE